MNRIQVSPEIHFGKPCVTGTRIPVKAVLELVREGIPFDVIIRDYYPDITKKDIQACVQYAIDVVQTGEIHVGVSSRVLAARFSARAARGNPKRGLELLDKLDRTFSNKPSKKNRH